jgi:hypothetical protein
MSRALTVLPTVSSSSCKDLVDECLIGLIEVRVDRLVAHDETVTNLILSGDTAGDGGLEKGKVASS